MLADYRTKFEPDDPKEFKQLVMDHCRRYLDMKRMRFGL
jgi:hypothetical protein